jgi:hypothetical protein
MPYTWAGLYGLVFVFTSVFMTWPAGRATWNRWTNLAYRRRPANSALSKTYEGSKKWFGSPTFRALLGDLEERYEQERESVGMVSAEIHYWTNLAVSAIIMAVAFVGKAIRIRSGAK